MAPKQACRAAGTADPSGWTYNTGMLGHQWKRLCGSESQVPERQTCLTNASLNDEWFHVSRSGRGMVSAVHEMKIPMQENSPEFWGHALIITYQPNRDLRQSKLEVRPPASQKANNKYTKASTDRSRRGSEVDHIPIPEIEFHRSAASFLVWYVRQDCGC